MISERSKEMDPVVTTVPAPSLARKFVGVLLNAVGIGAALGGVYFTFLVASPILDIAQLARSQSQRPTTTPDAVAGTANGVTAFLGAFDLLFIFVFGSIATGCFLVAVWLLDPFQRWREWRTRSGTGLPSRHTHRRAR